MIEKIYKKINWDIARSHYRKGNSVYCLIDNNYIEVPTWSFINHWEVTESYRSWHGFFFSTQKIRKENNIKRLKYFIKLNTSGTPMSKEHLEKIK